MSYTNVTNKWCREAWAAELNAAEKYLYLYLWTHPEADIVFSLPHFPHTYSSDTGLSIKTIQRALSKLEKIGAIAVCNVTKKCWVVTAWEQKWIHHDQKIKNMGKQDDSAKAKLHAMLSSEKLKNVASVRFPCIAPWIAPSEPLPKPLPKPLLSDPDPDPETEIEDEDEDKDPIPFLIPRSQESIDLSPNVIPSPQDLNSLLISRSKINHARAVEGVGKRGVEPMSDVLKNLKIHGRGSPGGPGDFAIAFSGGDGEQNDDEWKAQNKLPDLTEEFA